MPNVTEIGVVAIAPKQPGEVWLPGNLSVDFQHYVTDGDAITAVTVAIRDGSGVDHAATMSATHTIDSPKVGVGMQGGQNGERYTVEIAATTTRGGVYEAEILVPVIELSFVS